MLNNIRHKYICNDILSISYNPMREGKKIKGKRRNIFLQVDLIRGCLNTPTTTVNWPGMIIQNKQIFVIGREQTPFIL